MTFGSAEGAALVALWRKGGSGAVVGVTGGSRGSQPGMTWTTGGDGAGVAGTSAASAKVGAGRAGKLLSQVAAWAEDAGGRGGAEASIARSDLR